MPEIGGAFVRAEGFEDFADAPPCRVDAALVGFAQQGLEFGEHHLDRIEIGAVRRQEEQMGAGIADGVAVGARHCSTQAVKAIPLIGPSSTKGATMRSWRSPARKVSVFQ